MHRIALILRELFGLIVDDALLAVATLVWAALVWGLAALDIVPTAWAGPALFAGLALILIESAARRARG